jgi:hypothetical protein
MPTMPHQEKSSLKSGASHTYMEVDMKRLLAVLVCAGAVLGASVMYAAESDLPVYNMAAHCNEVAEAVGGSYAIESGCMDMEKEAKAALAIMNIEQRILKYCDEIAKAVGGSYEILKGCIDMEMEAKKNLGK